MSKPTFNDFTKSTLRNAWVKEPGIALYVRRAIIPGVDFDLANMEAVKPGKGALTAFLDKYEPQYRFHVEMIHNRRLVPYLRRRGYIELPNREVPCMIMG